MDTGKVYHDSDGNECTIFQMVKREPYWAANRIQEGEKAIDKLKALPDEDEIRAMFMAHPCGGNEYCGSLIHSLAKRIGKE